MPLSRYLRIWLACARYAIVRNMMFRGDLAVWTLVEFFWMGVNVLAIKVIYGHTRSIAGWSQYELLMLVGTGMLIQRLTTGFFWSSLFEMSRSIRTGAFDFFLAQPGHPLFMASTRKLDPDGLINAVLALVLVGYSAHRLGLHPDAARVVLYAGLVIAGVVVHYSIMVLTMSLTFWLTSAQGFEGSYFTMSEFGRLPRQAFQGAARVIFVWILPMVVVGNVPAQVLMGRPAAHLDGWLHVALVLGWIAAVAAVWLALAVAVFNRGLRRYSSASS